MGIDASLFEPRERPRVWDESVAVDIRSRGAERGACTPYAQHGSPEVRQLSRAACKWLRARARAGASGQ